MSATDEQRRLLDELRKLACDINEKEIRSHSVITLNQGRYNRQFRLDMNHDWLNAWHAELERILQAVEATLGRGTCQKVYLVETSDDLIESWYPIGVYLNSKAAEDCAEALRGEVDGIRQFARVVELKVVGR